MSDSTAGKIQVNTPNGALSVTVRPGPAAQGPSLLLLHSNSSSSRAFQHITSNPPPGIHQAIAPDFLGHGDSDDASGDTSNAYTFRGYAESAIAVLHHLEVRQVIVLGWSVGGHVAIEMLPLLDEPGSGIACRGVMLTGAPPANGAEQVRAGFDVAATRQVGVEEGGGQAIGYAAMEAWDEGQLYAFVATSFGVEPEGWMLESGRRTVGRARRIMIDSFVGGRGRDQRRVLEMSDVPCAVVNGGAEPCINLDYVDGVRVKNLWEGKCYRLPGLGHAPFWQKPDVYREYLWRFVKDCL